MPLVPENTDSVLVVIPAYNEEKSIGGLLRRLYIAGFTNIIVVDDTSSDGTSAIALEYGATVLPLQVQLGAWGAAQTGIRYGYLNGYSYIITVDADGQHLPESIAGLLHTINDGKYDVVVGAYPERGSTARHIAWWTFRKLSGIALHDLTSGLRVYNNKSAQLVADANVTLFDYQDLGVLLYLRHRGMSIKEVPVVMDKRLDGKSRIFDSWGLVAKYMLNTIVLCISLR